MGLMDGVDGGMRDSPLRLLLVVAGILSAAICVSHSFLLVVEDVVDARIVPLS